MHYLARHEPLTVFSPPSPTYPQTRNSYGNNFFSAPSKSLGKKDFVKESRVKFVNLATKRFISQLLVSNDFVSEDERLVARTRTERHCA